MRRQNANALTARERQVLALIRVGLTNEEIAQRLGITLDGAKYHVSQILSKLGVATREEATAVALGERRRWWARWPVWAKIGGAATVAAAGLGLAVLAWGVLRTEEANSRLQSNAQGAVRIDSISPGSGTIGTELVIRGSGFDSTDNDIGFASGTNGTAYLTGIPSPDGGTLRFELKDTLGACPISQTASCVDIGFPLPAGELNVAVYNVNGTSNAMAFRREASRIEIAQSAIDASPAMQDLKSLLDEIVRDSYQPSTGAYLSSVGIGIRESETEVYIELELRGIDLTSLEDDIPDEIAGYQVRVLQRPPTP
jgi:DNA-binding CsgD family transcriptional regulator